MSQERVVKVIQNLQRKIEGTYGKLEERTKKFPSKFGSIGILRLYCSALQELEAAVEKIEQIMGEIKEEALELIEVPTLLKGQVSYYDETLDDLQDRIVSYKRIVDPCGISREYAEYLQSKEGESPLKEWERSKPDVFRLVWEDFDVNEDSLAQLFERLAHHLESIVGLIQKEFEYQKGIPDLFDSARVEDIVYEGFRIRLVRRVNRTLHQRERDNLNAFKGALAFIKKRLKRYAPQILKGFPTIVFSLTEGTFGTRIYPDEKGLAEGDSKNPEVSGFYVPVKSLQGYIYVKGYDFVGVKRLARTIVHEAAHAFYYEDMSPSQRKRWEEMFELEEAFDLRSIAELHKRGVPLVDYPYEYQYIVSNYGLKTLLAKVKKGDFFITLPVIRPSHYGRTNASEAFSEIIVNAIIEGPRSINEKAWAYLRKIVGSTVKRNPPKRRKLK